MENLKIFIAGHNGMVGSALVRLFKKKKVNIITKDRIELDLLNQNDVQNFFKLQKIDQVYLAAAKVGGIHANNIYPAEFIYQNLVIQTNIIHSAFLNGVKKLLFLGSSCIYPKNTNQPIKEEELLNGKLEPTNEPYAIAKISGVKLCESYNRQYGFSHKIDYRSIMPTNLYGLGDNYHPDNSHVIPSLIHRFHQAKINKKSKVAVWGTGNPRREFMFVGDLAKAAEYVMNIPKKKYILETKEINHINVGSGSDISIHDLSKMIKEVVGYKGQIEFDNTKPDGTMKKLLDSGRLNNLGWKSEVSLKEGLKKTYIDYLKL